RLADGGEPLRADHRGAPGPEGGLPGGDRLQPGLAESRATVGTGGGAEQDRLRPVSPAPAAPGGDPVKVIETALPCVLIIEPKAFGDHRGFFLETFQVERYREAGITLPFVQDNH